jgi:hypothetical protein
MLYNADVIDECGFACKIERNGRADHPDCVAGNGQLDRRKWLTVDALQDIEP